MAPCSLCSRPRSSRVPSIPRRRPRSPRRLDPRSPWTTPRGAEPPHHRTVTSARRPGSQIRGGSKSLFGKVLFQLSILREGGSPLLEGGMPEHDVQRFLGHANLSTPSRYFATTRRRMQPGVQALCATSGSENRKKLQARCKFGEYTLVWTQPRRERSDRGSRYTTARCSKMGRIYGPLTQW